MTRPSLKLRLSRDARIGIVLAVLVAIAAICFDRGWHITGIILALLTIALFASFYGLIVRPARVPKDAVLTLYIADGLREDAPRSPFELLRNRGMPTLVQLREALEGAARDPALKAVMLEISAPGLGLATTQELHDLLRKVVSAGKRVIAILSGDNVSVRDYFLACGAAEIVVNPDTAMMMLGVSAGGIFLKQALAKLGVEAQTLQWKEYKGAAETFNRETMSPELRESLDAILADWKSVLTASIAASRKLAPERAGEWLGAGFMSAQDALEAGLIDRLGYIDDLHNEFDPEHKNRCFISLARYLRHLAYQRTRARSHRLALIHGLGPVVAGEGPAAGEFLSGERVAEEIRRAARDERINAIVFRVNSPGGSAVGSDLVWRAVREARDRGKPVVVSMGDVAGSGGYYVAMGADAIVAEPTTITGSIGVVYTKFSLPTLLARLGIGFDSAKSDPISDALSFSRAMTEPELAQVNRMVGQLYANFTAKVAEGRKLDPSVAEDLARGRVWSGIAAQKHGLIDALGGLDRAVAIARAKAGLAEDEAHDLVSYPPRSLLTSLNLDSTRAEAAPALSFAASITAVPPRWIPAIFHLLTRGSSFLQLSVLLP